MNNENRAAAQDRCLTKTKLFIGIATLASALLIFGSQAHYFVRLHTPAFTLFWQAPPVVRLHAVGAFIALILGSIQLVLSKGGGRHRIIGWAWSGLMLVVAGSSLFIASRNGYSPVHILTVLTLIGIPVGIHSVRHRQWSRHAKVMRAVFAIGLVAGGIFNFMPERLLWKILFG